MILKIQQQALLQLYCQRNNPRFIEKDPSDLNQLTEFL